MTNTLNTLLNVAPELLFDILKDLGLSKSAIDGHISRGRSGGEGHMLSLGGEMGLRRLSYMNGEKKDKIVQGLGSSYDVISYGTEFCISLASVKGNSQGSGTSYYYPVYIDVENGVYFKNSGSMNEWMLFAYNVLRAEALYKFKKIRIGARLTYDPGAYSTGTVDHTGQCLIGAGLARNFSQLNATQILLAPSFNQGIECKTVQSGVDSQKILNFEYDDPGQTVMTVGNSVQAYGQWRAGGAGMPLSPSSAIPGRLFVAWVEVPTVLVQETNSAQTHLLDVNVIVEYYADGSDSSGVKVNYMQAEEFDMSKKLEERKQLKIKPS